MTLDILLGAIRTSDLNTFLASPSEVTEWDLAEGEGQSARGHRHVLYGAVDVDVTKGCGRDNELTLFKQAGTDKQTTIIDLDSELPKTRNNILLHLTGHAGLTRTGVCRGVRIRIGGKGTVLLRRFIETYSAADIGVALRQLLHHFWHSTTFPRRQVGLLCGKQEL